MTHIRPLEAVRLSPAQLRVLRAVAAGRTDANVARDIGRSESTIKNTLIAVRAVLGALNTTHAVALMDDHCPGWRPRLPFPARPSTIPTRFLQGFVGPETGPRRAGAS